MVSVHTNYFSITSALLHSFLLLYTAFAIVTYRIMFNKLWFNPFWSIAYNIPNLYILKPLYSCSNSIWHYGLLTYCSVLVELYWFQVPRSVQFRIFIMFESLPGFTASYFCKVLYTCHPSQPLSIYLWLLSCESPFPCTSPLVCMLSVI